MKRIWFITVLTGVVLAVIVVGYLLLQSRKALWTKAPKKLTASDIQTELVGTWCSLPDSSPMATSHRYTFDGNGKCSLTLTNDVSQTSEGNCAVDSSVPGRWQVLFAPAIPGEMVQKWPLLINQEKHLIKLDGNILKSDCR
jgi:hypothetical protein